MPSRSESITPPEGSAADAAPTPGPPPVPGGGLALSVWCVTAAAGTYFCMYAFRKPFTAATFADDSLAGVGYKTVLVTAQVLGYTLSKFIGIRFIAEVRPERRAASILGLIGLATLALLGFGLVPPPYNFVFLFLNGLPLGMVFGLVLGFLEGRRTTELLVAGLCVSFILADGAMKSVGASLLRLGASPYWMPFLSGVLFVPPLLLGVWMLTRIPAPSAADTTARSRRVPMSRAERRQFFARYAGGLSLMVLAFLLVTVLRSLRADFAPEIWRGLGADAPPAVFTYSEILVGVGVMLASGLSVLVRDNWRAFSLGVAWSVGGLLLVGASVLGRGEGWLGPFAFMVLLGLGLYLPYVAVHTTLFERLIAMTRDRGNIGYLMYLADSFGYLGYVAVMFARNGWGGPDHFIDFFDAVCWPLAAAAAVAMALCWLYFALLPAPTSVPEPVPARS